MTKPFIRQRLFSGRYLVPPPKNSDPEFLSVDYLNEVSVFETLRAYDGKVFLLDQHLGRFWESAHAMGREIPIPRKEVSVWVSQVLKESGFRDALMRLMIYWKSDTEGVLAMIARHFVSHPKELYQKGVSVKTTTLRRFGPRAQDPQIKASQFMNGVLAALEKCEQPVYEWIFMGDSNRVAEGSVSNLFLVDSQKRLLTPALASGILGGVTRSIVMELARKKGFEVIEMFLTRHDFYNAAECFLTNTSSEVMPVVTMDARSIGNGKPGTVTQQLQKEFKKWLQSDAH